MTNSRDDGTCRVSLFWHTKPTQPDAGTWNMGHRNSRCIIIHSTKLFLNLFSTFLCELTDRKESSPISKRVFLSILRLCNLVLDVVVEESRIAISAW
jgi:hypothetical protein